MRLRRGAPCVRDGSKPLYVSVLPNDDGGSVTATLLSKKKPTDATSAAATLGEVRKKGEAVFVARWSTRDPPQRLEFVPTSLTFRWRLDCAYPARAGCPDIRLTDTGLSCGPGQLKGDECLYNCPAVDSPFTLPAAVTFSTKDVAAWSDTLHYAGETLSSYVERDSRTYDLDLDSWGTVERVRRTVGDRVDAIELTLRNGTTYQVDPLQHQYVGIPGGTCGAVVRYRLVGERGYYDRSAKIAHGQIRLEAPSASASLFSASIAAMGGMIYRPQLNHGTGQPFFGAELALRAHYRRAHFFLTELHAFYMYADQPYLPVRAGEFGADQVSFAPYYRAIFGIRPVFRIGRVLDGPVEVIPDIASLAWGGPLRPGDSDHVGGVDWFYAPGVALRFLPIHRLLVEFRTMFIVDGDTLRSARFNAAGPPETVEQNLANISFGANVGYNFY